MANRFSTWYLCLLLPLLWVGGVALNTKALHPFYVSITEVQHNASENSLEVSCKIFTDDLEQVLKQNFKTPVDLSNTAQHERSGTYINTYIQKHLQLQVNGKTVPLKYLGYEIEKESVYCYFEGAGVASVKKLDVLNSLLHDAHAEQINIMHVLVNGSRKSTKLDNPARNASFQF